MKPWQDRLARAIDGEDDVEGVEVAERRQLLTLGDGREPVLLDTEDADVAAEFTAEDVPDLIALVGRVNDKAIGDIPPGCALFLGMRTDRDGTPSYRFSVRRPHAWNMVPTPEGWRDIRDSRGEPIYPLADLERLP